MIKLFEPREDGLVNISDEARTIQAFKLIIQADKGSPGDNQGRKKEIATKELAFIYFTCKFDNPFGGLTEEEKTKKVKSLVGLPDSWKPSQLVLDGQKVFLEMQRTKSMTHLENIEHAINQMSDFLRNTNLDERIDSGPHKGELVHDLNHYKALTKDMPSLIKAYNETKNWVLTEMAEKDSLRAGREVNEWTE
jgi:hypothetical protein